MINTQSQKVEQPLQMHQWWEERGEGCPCGDGNYHLGISVTVVQRCVQHNTREHNMVHNEFTKVEDEGVKF
jgi:hypothetical protein